MCQKLDLDYHIFFNENKLGKSSSFLIKKRNDCFDFLEYIYKDRGKDRMGFDRKYEKFKKCDLPRVEHTSKYTGVCLVTNPEQYPKRPWMYYYKRKTLGYASTEEEAHRLRQEYINYANNKD